MDLALLFPIHLRGAMKELSSLTDLEEIRIRIGQPVFFHTRRGEFLLMTSGEGYVIQKYEKEKGDEVYRITEQDLFEMQNYISNYSLYAFCEELKNGFLTIQGGHRIGIAGGTVNENGRISGISYLTFLNIRVAHEKKGCADEILPKIRGEEGEIYNTLIISPPGAGKTTFLRDCIRILSYGRDGYGKNAYEKEGAVGKKIGLVDERSELAACYHGVPQNDIGPRTDVLDGCNKAEGVMMLLRTMSPEVIAVDELGSEEDFKAVEQAAYSGCRILGTLHAGSIKELQEKPILKRWCKKGVFERFVLIKKGENGERTFHIYNQRWEQLC